jgi:hypothetical protein
MNRRASALLGACTLLLSATHLAAQGKPQTREGFNISFGLGGGSAGLDCTSCPSDRQSGGTMYLNIGGTVTPRLTVGGEINGWAQSSSEEDDLISSMMAVVHFYPVQTQGFFLSGGVGFTTLMIEGKGPFAGEEIESTGAGVQLGAGYDWRVARNFSLTPYAQFVRSFGAEATENGIETNESLNPNFFQIGLGFTWH